jgi:YesN/AraC family two-component response regulator
LKKGIAHFPDTIVFKDTATEHEIYGELADELSDIQQGAAIDEGVPEMSEQSMTVEEKTILLVDDDEEMVRYLFHLLSPSYHVISTNTPREAIDLVKRHLPDIIISDVMMPGMTGVDFCDIIKKDSSLSHIPVVLLTGSSSTEVKLKGVECGAEDYISKPFDKDLLLARVKTILKSRTNLQKYFYGEVTLQQNTLKVSEEDKHFLDSCIAVVEKHIDDENFTVKILAKELGMSHSKIYKKIKSISDQSVNGFIRFIRLRKAAQLLVSTDLNVNEVAFRTGFNDPTYFRKQFNQLFEINPSDYIKKYRKPFQQSFSINEKFKRT